MTNSLLSEDEVILAINRYLDKINQYEQNREAWTPGLCWAFCLTRGGEEICDMIAATGGKKTYQYFWPRCDDPYLTCFEKEEVRNQRLMYLAFLLAWIDNP
jgi:hypothetical protein